MRATVAHSGPMTSSLTIKNLVLLGAGHAHVHVLHGLAQRRPADLNISVIAPYPRQLYSGMVPGFMAGHYTLDDCVIPLQPLIDACGARYVNASAIGLDLERNRVLLNDGHSVAWDWLSVNTGPVLDRDVIERQMPGARANALFVRPIEAFGKLWPEVRALAATRPIHVAVVGAGAAGLELAMAAAHVLPEGSRVTVVTGGPPVAANYPQGLRQRVQRALRRLKITVLPEVCSGFGPGEVRLASGARLPCDAPLLAVGAQAPGWLQDSGLALDEAGFMAVNSFQQSTHHAQVFAAGDVASRVDAPHPRSGVYAVRAGPPLLENLRASMAGEPLKAYHPAPRSLNLLACGDRYAVGAWGNFSFEGRWVWRWKDRIDRAFIAQYTPGLRPHPN